MNTLEKLLNRYTSKNESIEREIALIVSEINTPSGVESEEEAEYIREKYEVALISKTTELEVLNRVISDIMLEIEADSSSSEEETEWSND